MVGMINMVYLESWSRDNHQQRVIQRLGIRQEVAGDRGTELVEDGDCEPEDGEGSECGQRVEGLPEHDLLAIVILVMISR